MDRKKRIGNHKIIDHTNKKYENFIADLGECPPGYSLERADNNKPYSPDNCRWIPRKEQQRNKRTSVWITFNGKTQLIIDWAKELNINQKVLYARHAKGKSAEEVLSKFNSKTGEEVKYEYFSED